MDKDHRLEAPNDETLSKIEQIEDRSQLAAVYTHAHDEWEGSDILSKDDRNAKRDQEQVTINVTARKWFPVIGILTPMPFIVFAVLAAAISQFNIPLSGFILLPLAFAVALWGYISIKSLKAVYEIFYNHSIKATPFVVILVFLLGIALHPLMIFTDALHTEAILMNTLLISTAVLVTSILLSGILIMIWTTRRMSSHMKMLAIGALVLFLGLLELSLNIGNIL